MIKQIVFNALSLVLPILLVGFLDCSLGPNQTGPDINNQKLDEAYNNAKNISGLKSLVISVDGIIIREAYYNAGAADAQQDVRSVTKSVVSILVGISIDKGFIKSIDQTIGEFLTPIVNEVIPPEKAKITIRNLLTMTSGLEWRELGNVVPEYNDWVNLPNQILYMLHNPLVTPPGQTFNYNTGAIHFLSVIISLSSKMRTVDFAQKYLFDSLGIVQRNWLTDKQGYNNGGAGLSLTPHDMIRIGNLILNRGEYNGKRVVSANWIDQSVSLQISTNNILPYLTGYGYGIWNGNQMDVGFAMAMGWGDQFILIAPRLNLIVSATCNWNNISDQTAGIQWTNTLDLIMEQVLPAFE